MFLNFLLGIVAGLLVAAAFYFLIRFLKQRAIREALGLELFLVKIPKEAPAADAKQEDFKAELGRFESLLTNLLSLKKPFVFEVAVPHVGEEIHFYMAVPRESREVAAKQVQGLWNGASIEAVGDDYTIFNPAGAVAGAYLMQKENYALPVRTYGEIGADTFEAIVGGFAKIREVGEGAALQVVLRHAPDDMKKKALAYTNALKKGEPLERVFGHESPFELSELAHVFNPEKEEKERRKEDRIVDEDAVKSIEGKVAKPLFEANVRVLASAGSAFQAQDVLDGILAGFHQFESPQRNEFRIVKPRNPARLVRQFIFREFDGNQTMLLSSEELASIYHLPTARTETPRVKWLKSKEAPPPASLPAEGVLLGQSVFRGETKPIFVGDEDRRRHIYVIGQTGTGKSTLLASMIVDDIRKGKGVAMVDPHGDLAESVLGYVPPERRDDVIYFDPADLWKPLGLNMLDYHLDRPEEKTFIVNEMQSIFNKLFPPETMGPMFEQYMRNALLLLMEDMANEPATLIEVPRVFTDPAYRARKLARVRNPVVIDFWQKEAAKAGGEASLANMTPYITSKFNNFISNDYMRPIIGQPKSAFNFREVMDQGKILLVNLSKGRIGDINAGLLGMVVTGKLLMAALSRVDIPDPEARRDFNLYVDEFQNFTTDSIATILSEARKYRLNLTMAHQFIAQLTEKIRDAVFGNVGSQVVFRVGAQDAEFLVKQFAPVFSENDLVNIDNFNAYAKLLIRGETAKPFNMKTLPLAPGDRARAEDYKKRSRERYGADRGAVEESIFKRLRE